MEGGEKGRERKKERGGEGRYLKIYLDPKEGQQGCAEVRRHERGTRG